MSSFRHRRVIREHKWRELFHILNFGPVVAFRWMARPGWPVRQVTANVEQFGYCAEDFLSGKILYGEIIHPDDLERVSRDVEKNIQQGSYRFFQEYRILASDGSVRWVYDMTLVEPRRKGGVASFVGYVFDVTPSRLAQSDFLDSETKFRNFIEQARDGMFLLDETGTIVEWNKALSQLLQITSSEAVGHPLWELPINLLSGEVGGEQTNYKEEIIALYQQLLVEPINLLFEQGVILPDGSQRFGQITSFPVDTRHGKFIGAVVRDVTELKQAEQERKRRIEELRLLYEVSLTGLQAETQDQLIGQVTDMIGRFLPAENYGLFLFDSETRTLYHHHSYCGLPPSATTEPGSVARGVTGQVALSGNPLRIDDTTQHPGYWDDVPGIRSELCVPVKIGAKVVAVINVESATPSAYSPADERWLATLAGYLATAIERQRLLELERRRRYESEILRTATSSLVSSLDINEVLNAILENLQKVVEYDSATLFLYQENNLVIAAARGLPDVQGAIGKVFPANGPLFVRASTWRNPIVVRDVHDDIGFTGWAGTNYVRGWMGISLFAHDELVGYLTVDSRKVDAYQSQDAILAQTFANHAALAIEHARLYENIRSSFLQTALALANAIEARDQYTGDHSQRLASLAEKTGRRLGMTGQELEDLRWAGILHDVGKIGVPDAILRKPGPLDADEWKIMRLHPEIGAAILKPVRQMQTVIPIIQAHQEKFDGSGYPAGLSGEQIPLGARILMVVDTYSAIIDDRIYRKGRSHEQALEEIIACAGHHFDPHVVRAFIEAITSEDE